MRAGGTTSRSNPADDFANADNLADFHGDHGQMPIAGDKTVAVTDLHHVAIAALAAGNGDVAGGRWCAQARQRPRANQCRYGLPDGLKRDPCVFQTANSYPLRR